MKKELNNFSESGFTLVVIMLALMILAILAVYGATRTMKQVDHSLESDEQMQTDVPTPTIDNYQETMDNVKNKIDTETQKERDRLEDAAEELSQ